jgi:predicted PurR-regulated permease PerM
MLRAMHALVARAAGTVLLIFVIAAVIALILNPVVGFVQRGRMPRSLTVIAVDIAFFTTLVDPPDGSSG